MKPGPVVALLSLVLVSACGEPAPLYRSDTFTVTPTEVVEGEYRAEVTGEGGIRSNFGYDSTRAAGATPESLPVRPFDEEGFAVWSALEHPEMPKLRSDQPLVDALHRLSLDEMRQDVRPDGAFMAGAKWEGVWTRDISYSILLSLALLDPETSRRSLLAKVADGRIVQDTGTGGSWPVSSDRVTWALAAWEVYLATGDEAWLAQTYDIISRSVEADLAATFDEETGLFFGESSFLDWREQSYPAWMDPKDIYRSQSLGTNAVFFRTFSILAEMAVELGEPADRWDSIAGRVREGMNSLLWDGSGYGQYRYGRLHPTLSPRREALGAALSVLFGVPDETRADSVLADLPLTAYGVPTIWPQIPGIEPYHNDSVWPFVVAYSAWAAAEAGNTAVVEHGLGSIYRAAALFLTNKENLVASTGHFEGTQINSDRQLWSVAGTLATVYRVLLGIRMHPDRLEFRPFVPPAYDGERRVENLRWRGALLTVTVEGFGDAPESVELDGRRVPDGSIPASLTGPHEVVIRMNGRVAEASGRPVATEFAPATPVAEVSGDTLRWEPIEGASGYVVVRDGTVIERMDAGSALVHPLGALPAEFQVLSEATNGHRSFLSEPIRLGFDEMALEPPQARERRLDGWQGIGYLTLTGNENRSVVLRLTVPEPGRYLVDVRYANGSGPINTDNKAAVRSLFVDSKRVGTIVMPQRGTDRWEDWGYGNVVSVDLTAGVHLIELRLTDLDRNMNGRVNTALLDHVRLTRIDGPADETP